MASSSRNSRRYSKPSVCSPFSRSFFFLGTDIIGSCAVGTYVHAESKSKMELKWDHFQIISVLNKHIFFYACTLIGTACQETDKWVHFQSNQAYDMFAHSCVTTVAATDHFFKWSQKVVQSWWSDKPKRKMSA